MSKLIFMVAFLVACGTDTNKDPVQEFAIQLRGACPNAGINDTEARDECSQALVDNDYLRDAFASTVLWGGQPAGFTAAEVVSDASLTEFTPRVLKKMYLSTFIFEDDLPEVQTQGEYQVAWVPVRFRAHLPSGDYPYPFWHSEKKWASYQKTTHLMFVFKNGKVIAGVRSDREDANRPTSPMTFDGMWTWNNGQEPRVALFQYMFSPGNPHIAKLESTYRALEEGFRESTCITCHDPTNSSGMKHLELLSYPNQALSGRQDVVKQLTLNVMPPVDSLTNPTVGIDDEATRQMLLGLATEFQRAGDQAMAYEGE